MSLSVFALLLSTACATAATVETGAAAEPTFDGLYPVKHARVDRAWARPDFDLSPYTKIMLQGAGIHYRPVKRASARSGATEFPIPEDRKQELRDTLLDGFLKELQKSERFEFVAEPGPDVLVVRGALLDVVSRVPPQTAGRTDVYLSSVGEATFLIELIDSESETVLIRSIDRRAADTNAAWRMASNPVSNRAEVSRLAREWGRLLRDRLEYLADEYKAGSQG